MIRDVLQSDHPVGGTGRAKLPSHGFDGDFLVAIATNHSHELANGGIGETTEIDDRVLGRDRQHSASLFAAEHVRRSASRTMAIAIVHSEQDHADGGTSVEATRTSAREIVAFVPVPDVDHRGTDRRECLAVSGILGARPRDRVQSERDVPR